VAPVGSDINTRPPLGLSPNLGSGRFCLKRFDLFLLYGLKLTGIVVRNEMVESLCKDPNDYDRRGDYRLRPQEIDKAQYEELS
ncbi:MAG: hypothetical protein ACW975_14420, partial [Candidatus Thorarchaeota archaeon]